MNAAHFILLQPTTTIASYACLLKMYAVVHAHHLGYAIDS